MAAPAHLMTVGLNNKLNEGIRAWFKQYNFLPPIPLTAAQVDVVHGDVSFEDVLERLLNSPYKNFILIIHGHEDGSGLYLKLAAGQSYPPHTTHFDLQELMDVDADLIEKRKAGKAMSIAAAHVTRLLDLMHQVRAKQIDCIEFRSCNLGKNALSLSRFRQFLGARLVGAPDLHTVFGVTPVKIAPNFRVLDKHAHQGGNWDTYNFPNAIAHPDLVCCFQLNDDAKPESGGHILADRSTTFQKWVKDWIAPSGTTAETHMPMHSLWVADRKVEYHDAKNKVRFRHVPVAFVLEAADLTDPLGAWGNEGARRFIPPLSINYKKHIIYSR